MGLKWTAFLRLKGETQAENRHEMPFDSLRLVQFLQTVKAQYELFVVVEGEGSSILRPQNLEQGWEAWTRDEESGV